MRLMRSNEPSTAIFSFPFFSIWRKPARSPQRSRNHYPSNNTGKTILGLYRFSFSPLPLLFRCSSTFSKLARKESESLPRFRPADPLSEAGRIRDFHHQQQSPSRLSAETGTLRTGQCRDRRKLFFSNPFHRPHCGLQRRSGRLETCSGKT